MQQTHEATLGAAGKVGLTALDTPELNAETPPDLLDDEITPIPRLFVRNTGHAPEISPAAIAGWTLTIDGCVRKPQVWSLAALKREFTPAHEVAVLECAGNGRAFFGDPVGTVLWQYGAVGCIRWTGVRLADLLRKCEPLPTAIYTGHHSPDLNLEGTGPAISRGLPIAKAFAPETLIAYAMNGEDIPLLHGGPLRMVAPGFPGSAWQKWLTRISIRDREHDGERMREFHYRLPRNPVRYGDNLDPSQFVVITDMPVRALITWPPSRFSMPPNRAIPVRGFAWSGHTPVARVEISLDGGSSWGEATLAPATADRFAWRRFTATISPRPPGPIQFMARATDTTGRTQPLESVPWNPRGYCNNRIHRVAGAIE